MLILIAALPLMAVLEETASFRDFLLGSAPNCAYDNWVSHVAEGLVTAGYNTYAPYDVQTPGFGDYEIPTTEELNTWQGIVDLVIVGELDLAQASITAAGFPYQVVLFHDTDTGRDYRVLREIPDPSYHDDNDTLDSYDDETGAFDYGWGLYVFNPQGTRPVMVTAPHPCDDFPTPQFAYEAFRTWDAEFLLIAGAGREVRWTNVAPYSNAKSLSDPTRVAEHPFNKAYARFADKIRAQYSLREFSAQIHTYDWNYHAGYPNCQISAGYNRTCPNLPIRDLSSMKHDLINRGNHVMIPANTIGFHDEVMLNDFYAVNYNLYDFTFNDGEHEYAVNDYIDLPAYSQNYQMNYTLTNWSDYDTYDPFFHMEMDELPNSYDLTNNNYKWFYGWDENTQTWDANTRYTHFNEYYMRWVVDMDSLLDEMFAMNDQLVPLTPTELSVFSNSLNHITLTWNKTDSYDFDSYEILYATEPIGETNYQIFNRSNAAVLASPNCEMANVTGLNNSLQYYFRIRAKDKNGNFSGMSNEVTSIPAPAYVYNFAAQGMDSKVRLYWAVAGQNNNQGFSIYRKSEDGEYSLLDSYATNPALINPTASSFEYWDNNLINGSSWTYKISCTNINNIEFIHNYPVTAAPRAIHRIYIRNGFATLQDSIFFSINPYATDGQDNYYDVSKTAPTGNYVWNAFWQQYWGNQGTSLQREIKGDYDLDTDVKSWTMRVTSNQINQPLFIEASDDFDRSEKLWLFDSGANTWANLFQGSYQFQVANTNVRTMTLYWGNLQPKASHGAQANKLYQGGSNANFYWSNQNAFLIDHLNLYIKNDTDSIFVAENLPSTASSYNYMFSPTTNMQGCRFYIDVHAVDGVVRTYPSSYVFGILPQMNLTINAAGWQTRSKPWTDSLVATLTEVFGAGTIGMVADTSGVWLPEEDFLNNTAYWIRAGLDFAYSSTASINTSEALFPLVNGWNFIPNPHFCSYPVQNLRFNINNAAFQYSEMIQQGLISRGVYVYRNGKFELVDSIAPGEAFFIKYYGNQFLAANISLYPYYNAQSIDPPASDWKLDLIARSSSLDTAGFSIGTNPISTEGYDFEFDLPAPPEKPFTGLKLYAVHEDAPGNEYLDLNLAEDYRESFTPAIQAQKTWDFVVSCPNISQLSFDLIGHDFPASYTIKVILPGHGAHYYSPGDTFVFDPPSEGDHIGQIIVYNYPVSNSDLVNQPVSSARIYPNPFNPSTTIAFSTPKTQKVAVTLYNLKGQKVRSLLNSDIKGGSHQLSWDGTDDHGRSVASGIYFARISTRGFHQTLKMILMK